MLKRQNFKMSSNNTVLQNELTVGDKYQKIGCLALATWQNGCPNIWCFSFSAFAKAKSQIRHMKCYACSQDLAHLLFSPQPSSPVKLRRISWSRCQRRCISAGFCWGFSEQVAGSLLSRWAFSCQRSRRMKFPSLETPSLLLCSQRIL